MPTTPEAIITAITDASAIGFRGRLIARGQARAMIWRGGVLPPGAPAFSTQLSYDLHCYGYGLLGLGLRLLELGGDAGPARVAFEQAATALEAVMATGDQRESDRHFHFVMAAASYHLAHLSARAHSLLSMVGAEANFNPTEQALALLMRRDINSLRELVLTFRLNGMARTTASETCFWSGSGIIARTVDWFPQPTIEGRDRSVAVSNHRRSTSHRRIGRPSGIAADKCWQDPDCGVMYSSLPGRRPTCPVCNSAAGTFGSDRNDAPTHLRPARKDDLRPLREHRRFKLDFALRNDPSLLDNVGLLVFDEGHMIDPNEREVGCEIQIQRLVRRQDANQRRIVCLSAILPDGDQLDDFAAWLRRDRPGGAVKHDWCPTRLRFGEVIWNSPIARLNPRLGEERPFVPVFLTGAAPPRRVPPRRLRTRLFPDNQQELSLATAWRLVEF